MKRCAPFCCRVVGLVLLAAPLGVAPGVRETRAYAERLLVALRRIDLLRDVQIPQALDSAHLFVSIWLYSEVRRGRFAWG